MQQGFFQPCAADKSRLGKLTDWYLHRFSSTASSLIYKNTGLGAFSVLKLRSNSQQARSTSNWPVHGLQYAVVDRNSPLGYLGSPL